MRARLFHILAPVVVVALLLFGGWLWLRSYTLHGTTARVPDLSGLSLAEATSMLAAL